MARLLEFKSKRYCEALRARSEFIESLPPERKKKALEYQKEIDDKLRGAGSENNRFVLIRKMVEEAFDELGRQLRVGGQ